MKYEVDFQYLPKGASQTEEIGGIADLVLGEEAGFGLIPAIGDYVEIPRSRMGERENYRGRVCRRMFRYVLGYCYVRIVIEETEQAAWAENR